MGEPFDARAYLAAAAPAVGLDVPEDAVDVVAANLDRAAGFAALLDLPDLDAEEPAPVFRAAHEAPS